MTRILLALVIFLSFSSLANAQFKKGSLLIGGQLYYSGYTTTYGFTDQNNHTGNFNISLGKAIRKDAVFGLSLTFSPQTISNYYTQNIQEALSYKNNSYGIAIFYRKYKSLGKEFYIFGEAGGGYIGSSQSGKNESGTKLLSGSGNGGNLYLMPGIAYKISNKFFLEITIPNLFLAEFETTKTTAQTGFPQTTKNDQFVISTSLSSNPLTSLGIGFRLNL